MPLTERDLASFDNMGRQSGSASQNRETDTLYMGSSGQECSIFNHSRLCFQISDYYSVMQ